MSFDLGATEKGCLLLADITGYTQYMQETELLHAQDVVGDLLETIVGSVEPVFTLSKLEGDAAFAYADRGSVSPSMVMDTVESAYFSFQMRLRDIAHSTTCECNACVRIPSLNLKVFVHDGEYVVRRIARSEELTGSDVILVHRLAKGTAGELVDRGGYAVYTKSTLETMAMDPAILGFKPHAESFSDVGEVDVYVQDLGARWAFEQERNRDYVTSADAIYEYSLVAPVAPAMVWDYLTDPVKRPKWQLGVTEVLTTTEGRRGVGTINHCMHGPEVVIEHVADWRPFSYITLRYAAGGVADWAWTYQLEPVDEGTKVTVRLSDPGQDVWEEVGAAYTAAIADQGAMLESLLQEVVAVPAVPETTCAPTRQTRPLG